MWSLRPHWTDGVLRSRASAAVWPRSWRSAREHWAELCGATTILTWNRRWSWRERRTRRKSRYSCRWCWRTSGRSTMWYLFERMPFRPRRFSTLWKSNWLSVTWTARKPNSNCKAFLINGYHFLRMSFTPSASYFHRLKICPRNVSNGSCAQIWLDSTVCPRKRNTSSKHSKHAAPAMLHPK